MVALICRSFQERDQLAKYSFVCVNVCLSAAVPLDACVVNINANNVSIKEGEDQ
jgi:hypothetical protein